MSPKDDIMLKRIYTAEPWAEQTKEKNPGVVPAPSKRKRQAVSKNKTARGKGVEL
jgi:hypothetical protein